jgi:hypothetical protein
MIMEKQAKVTLNSITKRFSLSAKFDDFKQICMKAFNLRDCQLENFLISYIDDEDDKVIISNEFDYEQALLFLENPNISYLKINLEIKNKDCNLKISNLVSSQLIEGEVIKEVFTDTKTESLAQDPMRSGMTVDRFFLAAKVEEHRLRLQIEDNKEVRKSLHLIDNELEIENSAELNENPIIFQEKLDVEIASDLEKSQNIETKDDNTEQLEKGQIESENRQTIEDPRYSMFNPSIEYEKPKINIMDKIRKKIYEDMIKKEIKFIAGDGRDDDEEEENIGGVVNDNKISLNKNDDKEIQAEDNKKSNGEMNNQTNLINQNNEINQDVVSEQPTDKINIIVPENTVEEIILFRSIDINKNILLENSEEKIDNLQEDPKVISSIVVINQDEKNGNIELVQVSNEEVPCQIIEKIREEVKKEAQSSNVDQELLEKEINIELLNGNLDELEQILLVKLNESIKSSVEEGLNLLKENIILNAIERSNSLVKNYFGFIREAQSQREKMNEEDGRISLIKEEKNIEVPNSEAVIHDSIRCDGCKIKPIVGDRYKCSICKDFDFCTYCEDKNFLTNEHAHSFIRIRKPELSPELLKASKIQVEAVGNPQNILNDNGMIIDNSRVFNRKENYAAICLNEETKFTIKRTKNFNPDQERIMIKLRNVGSVAWPKPSFLSCLKEKSTMICLTSPIAAKIVPNDDINVEIKFDIPADIKPGKYFSYLSLYHSSSKNYFGDEICLTIIVQDYDYYQEFETMKEKKKKEFMNKVKEMRNLYAIPEDNFSNQILISALIKYDGDIEKVIFDLCDHLN